MKTGFTSIAALLFACTVFAFDAHANPYLRGSVTMDGSSTVFPIMEAVSEEYAHQQSYVKTPISISGTGGGFNRFIKGEIDITNASRPIKREEQEAAKQNDIQYAVFPIAYDGLTIIVNQRNTWLTHITDSELKQLWAESGKQKKWSDINPSWPQQPIHFYAPGVDSGTYDYFQETILGERDMTRFATFSEDDNVLVRGVMSDPYAIAFLGFAYYSLNEQKVRAVAVNGVLPAKDTIQSGRYKPLSRPLYMYVNKASIREKECVYDYLRFAFRYGGQLAEEVGYVQLPRQKYEQQLRRLDEIKKTR